ncbi:hypothetical protein LIA77_06800 [Sarocladium implicatum]|nr:hypothetical protein LIA77_06800 [Sarocladium implicatum]
MKSTVASAILAFTAHSLADPLYECNGAYFPNYDACDNIVQGWQNNADPISSPGANLCHVFTVGKSNCLIDVCFYTEASVSASKFGLYSTYESIIKNWCKPLDAGGKSSHADDIILGAWNNPEHTGAGVVGAASLGELALSQSTDKNGVTDTIMSKTDLDSLLNATAAAADEPKVKGQRSSKRAGIAARQEEDDSFDMLYIEKSIAKSGERFQASNILSPGVEEKWSFSDTKSVSVSTTVGVSAGLWDIFSISAEISTKQEHSETIESGRTFKVGDCDNSAIVYWVPLYNHYVGFWSSKPDVEWHAWIPTSTGDYAAGKWETECLG